VPPAILQVAPYYNKPTQEGLFQHFKAVAQSTKLPIMLYSIPGRCGIEIGVDTMARLHEACPNICAVKEAGGNPERVSQMQGSCCLRTFEILSGDDGLTLPFMIVGGCGIVSVAGSDLDSRASSARMVQPRAEGRVVGRAGAASSILPAVRRPS